MHYVWYSQPASGHPIIPNRPLRNGSIWQGTWNILSIENHVWGSWCVISGQIIVSWYMHNVWYSQPASEVHPITPNRPPRNGCIWRGTWNTLSIENHVWGPWCVISGQIIVSWYIHYVWYSQPASEEHPITPNRPLRNGCIWRNTPLLPTGHWEMAAFDRARETHWALKTMSGGPDVLFRDK